MSPTFYAFNFVGSMAVAYVVTKYGFQHEPNVGLLIGAALGTLISMALFGVK
jgi:hypothetical protein